jgi:3-hydroxyisobutyrate dehydrogenase
MSSVAVLGTGIMGTGMARNLLKAGHEVRVWNRTLAKAQPLAADGARVAGTPAEAVDGADALLTIVYDGPAALDAVRQAAPALRPGMVWSQSTTVGVDSVPELAAFAADHGVVFVDAPVLGTRQPAASGQLTVLAAGSPAARPVLAPVFDAIGSRTNWVGEDGATGAATRLKLVCNSWTLAVTHAAAEAVALAQGLGVDPQDFLGAIAGGLLDQGYLRMKTATILAGDFSPNFATETAEKDSRLIVTAGEGVGVRLDLAAAGAQRFRRAIAQGHGDEDMAASYFASFAGPAPAGPANVTAPHLPDGPDRPAS